MILELILMVVIFALTLSLIMAAMAYTSGHLTLWGSVVSGLMTSCSIVAALCLGIAIGAGAFELAAFLAEVIRT